MRKLFIILDAVMITVCGISVLDDIINHKVNTGTLIPTFMFALKVGYIIGNEFYKDYKTTTS